MGKGEGGGRVRQGKGRRLRRGKRERGGEKQLWLCSSFSVCLLNENLIVQP